MGRPLHWVARFSRFAAGKLRPNGTSYIAAWVTRIFGYALRILHPNGVHCRSPPRLCYIFGWVGRNCHLCGVHCVLNSTYPLRLLLTLWATVKYSPLADTFHFRRVTSGSLRSSQSAILHLRTCLSNLRRIVTSAATSVLVRLHWCGF